MFCMFKMLVITYVNDIKDMYYTRVNVVVSSYLP